MTNKTLKNYSQNWSIAHIIADEYNFHWNNEIVFTGTYSQCLCVLGAIHNNCSLEYAIKLAKGLQ